MIWEYQTINVWKLRDAEQSYFEAAGYRFLRWC